MTLLARRLRAASLKFMQQRFIVKVLGILNILCAMLSFRKDNVNQIIGSILLFLLGVILLLDSESPEIQFVRRMLTHIALIVALGFLVKLILL